jgi:aspartate/methionine/tyrosine aminotransferase
MNVLGEHMAEIALRPERLGPALEKARAQGRANLAHLDAFVEATPGLSWCSPQAGLIGLARLPDGLDGEDFARRLLAPPYHTFLLPGSAYGEPRHIRLGVGGDSATNLVVGLERVARLLAEMATDA